MFLLFYSAVTELLSRPSLYFQAKPLVQIQLLLPARTAGWVLLFASSNTFIRCDTRLFDSTSECAESKLFVSGNHTSLIPPEQDTMAAFLAGLAKSKFLENLDCLIA